ncbi:hypothetical protein MJN54_33035, partial [Salmonella enterica subsp. enterica serovar Kentucky]|nr:hypothetical protein [Salmonella enterica subsp. enterica serovar Kentucky]
GNATDLSGNTRAAKVCDGTNPQYGDSRQTDLERRQRGAEQLGTWIGLIPVSFSLTFFLAPYAARVALNIGSMNALSMLIICMMV